MGNLHYYTPRRGCGKDGREAVAFSVSVITCQSRLLQVSVLGRTFLALKYCGRPGPQQVLRLKHGEAIAEACKHGFN